MKNLNLLLNPLNDENPVTVQVLGICSVLAVTVQMRPAIVMAASVIVVTGFSNLIISLSCSAIGAVLIFAGMISLLLYKGSSPLTRNV